MAMEKKASIEIVDERSFASVVAEEIATSVQEFIEDTGKCSLVLSGGKTPASIYRRLAIPPLSQQLEWKNISLFWGDERFVPHSDNQSNARMVEETLLHNITGGVKVYQVDTSLETAEKCAEDYEHQIRKHFGIAEGELPEFDLVLLGMGSDGHTASLFPDQEIWDSGKICVSTTNPHDNSVRISLTPEVIVRAKKVFFLVKGEEKADTLSKIHGTANDEKKYPALIYRRIPDRVTWFIDTAAGVRLSME